MSEEERPLPSPEELPAIVASLCEVVAELSARQQAGEVRPWLTLDDPDHAYDIFTTLTGWLESVWRHYPAAALPECWWRHSWAIEELNACRLAWHAAQKRGVPVAQWADWHARIRPGTAQRIQQGLQLCDHEQHPVQRPAVPVPADASDVVLPWVTARDEPSPHQP